MNTVIHRMDATLAAESPPAMRSCGKQGTAARGGGTRRAGLCRLAGRLACGGALLTAAALAGCDLDLENPTKVTYETSNPEFLINGAVLAWMEGTRSTIIYEYVASDEAIYTGVSGTYYELDQTADLGGNSWYQGRLTLLSVAREQTRIAIQRARELGEPIQVLRGLGYRGWFLIGTAYRWGEQPIEPGGPVLTETEVYQTALEHFEEAITIAGELPDSLPLDSLRNRALAGVAWTQWEIGRATSDDDRLAAAIVAAEAVLADAPDFALVVGPDFDLIVGRLENGDFVPGPGFENVPYWANDPDQPQGAKLADWNTLWLILADAHLRRGELAAAKAALRSTPLLADNHVGLGRVRTIDDPVLSQAEVDGVVAPLDADGARFVIDELWRENFYAHGRRNVGPNGAIFPVPLPPEVL